MSSIESLKEQARRHEQKEEWREALDLYRQAIARRGEDDQPDIGLYNRVGDLQTRLGNLEAAADAYEQTVDLYLESELPNNAIAVCKKMLRHLPGRPAVFLRMGQIRAGQGFLVDARQNFLTYAERMQNLGDIDEAFRALIEFADLAPEDTDIRLAVASQMQQHDRRDDALQQLAIGYGTLVSRGREDEADVFEERIRELDPEADLAELMGEAGAGTPAGGDGLSPGNGLAEIELGAPELRTPTSEPPEGADGGEEDEALSGVEEFSIDTGGEAGVADEGTLEGFQPTSLGGLPEVEPAEEAAVGPADSGAEEGVRSEAEVPPLPLLGEEESEAEVDGERPGDEDVVLDLQEAVREAAREAAEEAAAEAASEAGAEGAGGGDTVAEIESLAASGDLARAMELARELVEDDPDEVAHRQRLVELAFRSGDDGLMVEAYLGLARCLDRNDQDTRARAVFQQVLSMDPDNPTARAALEGGEGGRVPVQEVASSEDYVDLGALILDEEEEEKTTRFVVAYEEPSGDEAADFAKMLSQFKKKVAENVSVDDVKAHHDLGTAYKEMGLWDEAIQEYQQALRASASHLPTYELLGQCFMEKGEPEAAIRSLSRALEVPHGVDDELIGIYYHLGRAHEAVGNADSAVDFYDRVFALDINFADVTERLRALR